MKSPQTIGIHFSNSQVNYPAPDLFSEDVFVMDKNLIAGFADLSQNVTNISVPREHPQKEQQVHFCL